MAWIDQASGWCWRMPCVIIAILRKAGAMWNGGAAGSRSLARLYCSAGASVGASASDPGAVWR
jgi:hypothetical protein